MATTYCTIADVKDLLSDNSVLYRTDDDEDGSVAGSGTEASVQANAIERAATKMNMALAQSQYTLSDLSANDWCKWCNATLAAVELCERRGNPVPQALLDEREYYLRMLEDIRRGIIHTIPETTVSHETFGTVTNLTTEPWRGMPVRRRPGTSTGKKPDGNRKSWPEHPNGGYSN